MSPSPGEPSPEASPTLASPVAATKRPLQTSFAKKDVEVTPPNGADTHDNECEEEEEEEEDAAAAAAAAAAASLITSVKKRRRTRDSATALSPPKLAQPITSADSDGIEPSTPTEDEEQQHFDVYKSKSTAIAPLSPSFGSGAATAAAAAAAATAAAEAPPPAALGSRLATIFSPVFTLFTGPAAGAENAAAPDAAVPTSPAAAGRPRDLEDYDDDDAVDDDEESYEDDEDFDPWCFIANLPPLSMVAPLGRSHILPRRTRSSPGHITLVLDLDETLVHSSLDLGAPSSATSRPKFGTSPANAPLPRNFQFEVECNGLHHLVSVRTRPYLAEFLRRASELFEVVIFTASQRAYAERLLDVIDPGRCHIKHRVYRDSCVMVDGNFLKDLTVLGRDLSKMVIVDNSPQAFGFQLSNGIPIESWFDDDSDDELRQLLPFLERIAKLSSHEDVRPHVVNHFRLHEKVENAMG